MKTLIIVLILCFFTILKAIAKKICGIDAKIANDNFFEQILYNLVIMMSAHLF